VVSTVLAVAGPRRSLSEVHGQRGVAEWADVLELEVYPVIEDDAAGAAATKVYGKQS